MSEEVDTDSVNEQPKNWVVRFIRKDNPDRWLWYDRNGNYNARLGSAMAFDKETAIQFAKAVNAGMSDIHARAYLYETSKRQKQQRLLESNRDKSGTQNVSDILKSEEAFEIEKLKEEIRSLKDKIGEVENEKNK